jgi:hypothetical protein
VQIVRVRLGKLARFGPFRRQGVQRAVFGAVRKFIIVIIKVIIIEAEAGKDLVQAA